MKKTDFSLKETGILIGGIAIIAAVFLIFALTVKDSPKTLDELHIANYDADASDTNFIYNGFSFLKLPDPRTKRMFWYTQIQQNGILYDVPMHYSPLEVEEVPIIAVNRTQARNYSKIYISVDPSNESRPYIGLAVSELSKKFTEIRGYPVEAACTRNETFACSYRPIVSCEDKIDDVVIVFNITEEPKVVIDDNCFIVNGQNETLIQATDKVIYRFLGIV